MRKVILAIVVVILASTAVAASPTYMLSPGPYGVTAWVPTEPNDVVLQKVEKAVQDVFSFWHQPLPQSAENWHELSEMQEDTWTESKYDPFTAGFVPIPSPTASPMWAIPLPTWKGEEILPLTLLIASNRSLVQSLAGSTAGAAFSARNMPNSVLSLNRDPSLGVLATRSDSVVLNYNSPDLRHDLDHELSHWLSNLICQRYDLTLQDVPRLLGEGFAEYTAFRLDGANREWRMSAAVWTEDGHGLSDVPMFLWYPIGTSLVSFLVERGGVDGFIENFPDLITNWDQIIPDITPTWQTWASNYEIDEAQRAYAEATIEQLSLCGMVLQPVLPEEAFSIFDRVYSLAGSMEDIEHFWKLISVPVARPSGDTWKQLQKETHTIVEVASRYSDRGPFYVATENEYQLSRLWAKGDWDGYYDLLIKTLRDVVAHYGTEQKAGVPSGQPK
jgi:hypothetical protein